MTYQVIVSIEGMDLASFADDTLAGACESAVRWFGDEPVSYRLGTL